MTVPILKERPLTWRDAWLPYLMVGINMLAPTLVARSILTPPLFNIVVVIILLGVPASLYFRQRSYNRIFLNLMVMVPLIGITWALLKDDPGLAIDWNDFQTSLLAVDSMARFNALLKVFTFLAAGRAFVLVTPQEILQTPIPSFAILLFFSVINRLSGTPSMANQPMMLVTLLLFCITTLYIISMEQTQRWFTIFPPLRVQRRIFWQIMKFVAVLFPIAVVLGFLMQPINLPALSARMYRNVRPPTMSLPGFPNAQVSLAVKDHVTMGDIGWPTSKAEVMLISVPQSRSGNYLWRATSYAEYEKGSWVNKRRDWLSGIQDMGAASLLTPALIDNTSIGEQVEWYNAPQKTTGKQDSIIAGIEGIDPGIVEGVKEGKIEISFTKNTGGVDLPRDILFQSIVLKNPVLAAPEEPIHCAYQGVFVSGNYSDNLLPIVADDSSVFMTRRSRSRGKPIDSYQVVSINKPSPYSMILDTKVSLPAQDEKRYTDMASSSDFSTTNAERIRTLARQIIDEKKIKKDEKYEINVVNALQSYLAMNFKYTLKPGRSKNNEDPTIDFLFNTKKGYCVYFAGAMVMLCRSVDIPARFVVGFATGDPVAGAEQQAGMTTYSVKAEHAHAWVEVFLPSYGWYPADPTAGSTPIPTGWESIWGGFIDGLTTAKNFVAGLWNNFRTDLRFRIYSIIVILLIGGVITLIVYLRSARPPRLPKEELMPEQAEHVVNATYRCMHRWLEQWGVVKPTGLTASEFELSFREINEPMGLLVAEISELYVRTRYAGVKPSDTQARRGVAALRELAVVAKTERRNLYADVDKVTN